MSEANDAHVVALEIQRFTDHNDDVFLLRGLDADDHEVASIRSRIGTIEDLPALLPTTETFGAELILSRGSFEQRGVSREVAEQTIFPTSDPALQAFLELAVVSSTLATHANIVVLSGQQESSGEAPFLAQAYGCGDNIVNVSPVASQCCMARYNFLGTLFFNVGAGTEVRRAGPKTACTSSSGGACSGSACYYGPNGFAKPVVSAATGTVIGTWDSGYRCGVNYYEPAEGFPDVIGTFPNGQGCPGGNNGAGLWDY